MESNLTVLIGGIAATILFLIGYGLTIKEFRELKEEDKKQEPAERSNATIRKDS